MQYYLLNLQGKKSAEDTLQTARLLMEHGLRDLINEADSLGNTPLHHLIGKAIIWFKTSPLEGNLLKFSWLFSEVSFTIYGYKNFALFWPPIHPWFAIVFD